MKIVTWNVNSINARLQHVLRFLEAEKPDIVLLQEIKCMDDAFPAMEIEERGYSIATHGQKTYNGVAILSKHPLEDITRGLPGDDEDTQARYIEAVISIPGAALRVASIYVPNGQSPDSDKFPYKLKFLERLRAHAATLLAYEEMLVWGGDYNVAPFPADVYDPDKLDGTTCYHPAERALLRALMHDGLYDAYRLKHPESQEYSWWDYRANSFAADKGYRIDHHLLSPQAADKLVNCTILKDYRAEEKASDHAPVVVELH